MHHKIAGIIQDLAQRGWSQQDGILERTWVRDLAKSCAMEAYFHRAGVNNGYGLQVLDEVRGDWIRWLTPNGDSAAEGIYLAFLEQLRQAVNTEFDLGIYDFEGHLTYYPPGTFYRRHLDQSEDHDDRRLTCVLYLNEDWQIGDGGALRIYEDDDGSIDLLPLAGRFICFFSDRYYHEVLPASRLRKSVTGWFKQRSNPP